MNIIYATIWIYGDRNIILWRIERAMKLHLMQDVMDFTSEGAGFCFGLGFVLISNYDFRSGEECPLFGYLR